MERIVAKGDGQGLSLIVTASSGSLKVLDDFGQLKIKIYKNLDDFIECIDCVRRIRFLRELIRHAFELVLFVVASF